MNLNEASKYGDQMKEMIDWTGDPELKQHYKDEKKRVGMLIGAMWQERAKEWAKERLKSRNGKS